MNKRPEQTEQTRQQIVDAFWSFYEERPIEHITVKEIVAKAGCHRSTFYEYFDNVYEILEGIESALLEKIRQGPPGGIVEPSPEDILRHQIEAFEDEGKYISVLTSEHGDPAFARSAQNIMLEHMKPRFASTISDEQASYIVEFGAGGLSALMTKWLRQGKDISVEDLMRIAHAFKEFEAQLLKGEVTLDK